MGADFTQKERKQRSRVGYRVMKRTAWIYPSIIYLMGITITLVYAFTTNYTEVSDTAREYLIYSTITQGGSWQALRNDVTGLFTIQSTCLTVTLFPALLQRLFSIEPLLFFKLYSSFIIPILPVVVYFIAKRVTSNLHAFLVAVLFMGQVCFLQAPSMARSNMALLFFALSLLVILRPDLSKRVKFPILFLLATGMVISHYGTTFASLLLLGTAGVTVSLWWFVRRMLYYSLPRFSVTFRLPYRNSILIVCLSLIVGIVVWYGFVTHTPLTEGISFIERSTSQEIKIRPEEVDAQEYKITEVNSRDKIIQAALGVKNPDGDTTFTFSWATFVFNWLAVMLMSYGLLITLIKWRRIKAVPLEYLALSIIGYATIVGVVVLPFPSRFYGIERTFYQMLVFLGIYFIFGCSDIAKRLKLKAYMVILPVLLPYFYFTYTTGIIHSITGNTP